MDYEKKNRLIPVTEWNKYHSWPPIGGLRHIIANRKRKKCEKVFLKPSGRWLIDENAFFVWARTDGGK